MRKINRMCSFYVNDWHLTVMILPYIKGKRQNKEKITIISEENLETNIETLLDRLNIKEENKKEIKQIGWNKTEINNIEKRINEVTTKDNIIVIGKENYIEETNKIIEDKIKSGEINVVDCYEVMQFNNNMEEILKKHEKIINTSGEKSIQEVFEGFSRKEVI